MTPMHNISKGDEFIFHGYAPDAPAASYVINRSADMVGKKFIKMGYRNGNTEYAYGYSEDGTLKKSFMEEFCSGALLETTGHNIDLDYNPDSTGPDKKVYPELLAKLLASPEAQKLGVKEYPLRDGATSRNIDIGDFCSYSLVINFDADGNDTTFYNIFYSDPTGTTYYDSLEDLYNTICGDKKVGKYKANPSHWRY